MKLHEIKRPTNQKTAKRVGRGGKRGTYSGRGMKGQKSRAGARLRPEWRDTLKRLPKNRGYRFSPVSDKPVALNLSTLEKNFKDGEKVTMQKIRQLNLTSAKKRGQGGVKILSNGNLKKKLVIEKIAISKAAKEKVEKAGGKVTI